LRNETALAKELATIKNRDDRLFSLLGNDCQLDPPFVDEKKSVRGIALYKYRLPIVINHDRLTVTDHREEGLRIKGCTCLPGWQRSHRKSSNKAPSSALSRPDAKGYYRAISDISRNGIIKLLAQLLTNMWS
jgi:hypothetical protein